MTIANHELKNPLTAIRVQAQLGMKYIERNEMGLTASALHTIESQTHRMEQLIKDLLDVSRMQSGQLEMHPIPINIVSFCRQLMSVQQVVYQRPFVAHLPDDPLTVFADSNRLRQVMSNLITNAVKYSPPESPLAISLYEDKGNERIVLGVQDQGIGIPVDELPTIFDQFYRATTSQETEAEGIGLGLYICKKIIEQHHGQMWVESIVNEGSTFYVCLPVYTAAS